MIKTRSSESKYRLRCVPLKLSMLSSRNLSARPGLIQTASISNSVMPLMIFENSIALLLVVCVLSIPESHNMTIYNLNSTGASPVPYWLMVSSANIFIIEETAAFISTLA